MWNRRYWSTERGSYGSLWFKICCLDTVIILGVQYSYNKEIQNKKNFCKVILYIQNIFKLWKMRSLTIEGKTTIFKTLALLKVVYLALLAVVPNHIIDELIKIQTNFIWENTPAEIKHRTLTLNYKQCSFKCADVTFKIISRQCSWLKRLFDDSFHEWKVIPLFYIKKEFGNNFKYNSNLDYKLRNKVLLPKFYKKILANWMIYFNTLQELPSCTLNQFLWYSKYVQINKKSCIF